MCRPFYWYAVVGSLRVQVPSQPDGGEGQRSPSDTTYKNRIRGLRRRMSGPPTTKSVSIQDAGVKSGAWVSQAVGLIAGDLRHVSDS
jgi:hypothetical protein